MPEIVRRDLWGNEIIPPQIECDCCGESFPEDDAQEHSQDERKKLCPDCVCSCEECGAIYSTDDDELVIAYEDSYRRHYNGETRCPDCCHKCADCGEHFQDELDRCNDSDEPICERCSEQYYSCESCNCVVHQEHTYSIPCVDDEGEETGDYEDGSYCESCYRQRVREQREEREERERERDEEDEDDEEESSPPSSGAVIRNYTYKPSPLYQYAPEEHRGDSPTFYGIEIETEGRGGKREHCAAITSSGLADDSAFYCKSDGSLKNGFEIVSHPGTFDFWQSHALNFCDALRTAGYRSYDTDTCGMHVHVSKSALSPAQRAKLLLFAKVNAQFLLFISRRKSLEKMNEWAAIDTGGTEALLRKARGETEGERGERYTAINLLPSRSIEFRIFRGTLDTASIRRNIAFVAALVAFVKSAPLSAMSYRDLHAWLSREGAKHIGKLQAGKLAQWIDSYSPAPEGEELQEQIEAA